MAKRFSDMDAAGIDMQVVSNTPQTFLYNQEAALTAALAALQNDQIATAVAAHPDRLIGIATLPMQAPQLAADELRRSMRKLGLKGAQIGSNVNGRNLDDPALEPLWAAANELGAFIMVHPTAGRGRGPAQVLLSHQSDRQSARHHHRRGLPGVRRRGRPLPAHQVPDGARRRLRPLPGRPVQPRLAGARPSRKRT